MWQCVQAMSKAPASCLEPKSRDWVPLFIAYSSARGTHHPTDTDPILMRHASPNSDSDSDSDEEAASEPILAIALEGNSESEQISQRQEGSCGVRVGAKAWRCQLKEWLGFVGGLQGAKGIFRSDDLKQCVVRHLLDTDSGVQQAALRALQVTMLLGSPHSTVTSHCPVVVWKQLRSLNKQVLCSELSVYACACLYVRYTPRLSNITGLRCNLCEKAAGKRSSHMNLKLLINWNLGRNRTQLSTCELIAFLYAHTESRTQTVPQPT